MQLDRSVFCFLLEVEHVVSCLGFGFATFVLQIHFAFVVQFLSFDLEVLKIFLLQHLALSTAKLLPSVHEEVSVNFALLILDVASVYVYPCLLEVVAIFILQTFAVSAAQM